MQSPFRMTDSSTDLHGAADRRRALRHYLAHPPQAELIFGNSALNFASGWIENVSDHGIGLHAIKPVALQPGSRVTVAGHHHDKVWTLNGRVASIDGGVYIGINVDEQVGQPGSGLDEACADSITVSSPEGGCASVSGKISMAARRPVQWAINSGATRLNMAGATALDSAGIGLLLIVHERNGLTIEKCNPQMCRLIKLCSKTLCAPDCPRLAD